MIVRTGLTVLLSSLPLLAQQTGEAPPAQGQGVDTAAEAVERPKTAEERVAELQKVKDALQTEYEYLARIKQAGGLRSRIQARLDQRAKMLEQVQSVDVPTADTGAVTAGGLQRQTARLLGDAEKDGLPPGTIATVNGLPILESEFDAMTAYLQSYPSQRSEVEVKQDAMMALIKAKAAEGAFPVEVGQARQKIANAVEMLKSKSFEEVARELSDCPSKAQGGDLGMFGRGTMDPLFAKVAFTNKLGSTSKIVQTSFGFHLIKVTGQQKGDTPDLDRVRASHILAMYHPDQAAVREVAMRVANGEVDLAFMSDDWREFAPAVFR